MLHYENLRLRLKLKKIHCVLEFDKLQYLRLHIEFYKQKRIEAAKNRNKDGKAFVKLMNNTILKKKQWRN